MKKKVKSIAICLAHNYENFSADFTINLLSMQYYFMKWAEQNTEIDYELSVLLQGGYQLDWMRNMVTMKALNSGHDYLLYLDADMQFPQELIPMMLLDLMANPEFNAVSGIYCRNNPPHQPLIYADFDKKTKSFLGIGGHFPLKRPFKIGGCGAGCLMVKRELFDNVKLPFFKFASKGEVKGLPHGLGEDLFFCWKLKPKLLCDPRLLCGHRYSVYTGLNEYRKYNHLKIKDNKIQITSEKMQKIKEEQDKGKVDDLV